MRTEALSAATSQELQTKLQKTLKNGFKPTLACVFCSVTQPLDQIRAIFAASQIAVFGCTTSGEIVNASTFEGGISVLLMELPSSAFSLRLFNTAGHSSYEMGQTAARWSKGVFVSPTLLLLSAGLQADGEAIVKGVIDTVGSETPLFGGLAGDNLKMQGTFAFTEAEATGSGVLALALDNSKITVKGMTISGWKGVGTMKTITRSVGNVVQTIDDQPALDVYSRYLNINVGDNQALAAEYPLLLMRDDGTYVLRAPLVVNPDKSMIYAGTVPEGSKVQFSLPPSTEIIDIALEGITKFKQSMAEVDAIVLFSCKARHLALGPMIDDEVSALHKLWGKPLAGFFSYGEIGPSVVGRCDFHNDTLSIVTLREK